MGTQTPDPASRLITAVRKGDCAAAGSWLDRGADPNGRDGYNLTCLMWAARRGHAEIIDLLTRHGADPNLRDNTQRTALHHAALFKRREALLRLLAAGADPNAKDMHGWTALDIAKSDLEYDLARDLVDAGAQGDLPPRSTTPDDQCEVGFAIGHCSGGSGIHSNVSRSVGRVMAVIMSRRQQSWIDLRRLVGIVLFTPGPVISDFGFSGIAKARQHRKYRSITCNILLNPEIHEVPISHGALWACCGTWWQWLPQITLALNSHSTKTPI